VTWILGNHIEMTRTPGRDYAMHIHSHPAEHRLELPLASLLELRKAVDAMGELPRLEVHEDFIVYPLP
jgi:hydroxyacylglutathione hydrolase